MSFLASEALVPCRLALNDADAENFDNDRLIPYMAMAMRELVGKLELNEIPSYNEISAVIPVNAGVLTLTLPADFRTPIKLEEAARGAAADQFYPMFQRVWEPSMLPQESLYYWVYREDSIKFLGATSDRDVKLYYQTIGQAINSVSSVVTVIGLENVLGLKTAHLFATLGLRNMELAGVIKPMLDEQWYEFSARRVKGNQSMPVKRPSFREKRRYARGNYGN
jgi:hypothetical protein